MQNNPFRNKPSINIQQKIEDWGKTKFKPTKFGSGRKECFKKFPNDTGGKFNEVARDAKPENPTPWNKYKNEIVFKQREEQAAPQFNMDSNEAKTMLKQRKINYRKSIVEQKKQEPIEWENFSEEEDHQENNSNEEVGECQKSKQNPKFKRKFKDDEHKNPEKKFHIQSKQKFKKNVCNSGSKCHTKEFISNELLENFDSRKLNYSQNDKLRRVITKTTFLSAGGGSLEKVVEAMKKRKIRKPN